MSTPENELTSKLQTLHESLDSKLVRDPTQAKQAIDAVSELIAAVEAKEIERKYADAWEDAAPDSAGICRPTLSCCRFCTRRSNSRGFSRALTGSCMRATRKLSGSYCSKRWHADEA